MAEVNHTRCEYFSGLMFILYFTRNWEQIFKKYFLMHHVIQVKTFITETVKMLNLPKKKMGPLM